MMRLWGRIVDGLGALGSVIIAALMALIVADVVARNGFNTTIPVVAEVGALSVVMILFLQLGTTIRHDRMARAEIFIESLRRRAPRAAARLDGVYDLLGAAVCGLIAWSTVGVLARDLKVQEFIGVLGVMTLPVWPFRALILLGASTGALHYLIRGVARLLAAGHAPR